MRAARRLCFRHSGLCSAQETLGNTSPIRRFFLFLLHVQAYAAYVLHVDALCPFIFVAQGRVPDKRRYEDAFEGELLPPAQVRNTLELCALDLTAFSSAAPRFPLFGASILALLAGCCCSNEIDVLQ